MANSGRGEAAKIQPLSPEPSNASCLHCPVDLVGVLNWPTEDGEIWDGQKGREGSQPEMGLDQMLRRAFCLRSRSSPGIWIRQHKMPEPVESSPLWCSGENRQEGRNMPSSHSEQRAGQDLEPGTCGHCPTPLPPPPHLFRWGTLLGKKAVDIAPDPRRGIPRNVAFQQDRSEQTWLPWLHTLGKVSPSLGFWPQLPHLHHPPVRQFSFQEALSYPLSPNLPLPP